MKLFYWKVNRYGLWAAQNQLLPLFVRALITWKLLWIAHNEQFFMHHCLICLLGQCFISITLLGWEPANYKLLIHMLKYSLRYITYMWCLQTNDIEKDKHTESIPLICILQTSSKAQEISGNCSQCAVVGLKVHYHYFHFNWEFLILKSSENVSSHLLIWSTTSLA